jgi:hypothetical protein
MEEVELYSFVLFLTPHETPTHQLIIGIKILSNIELYFHLIIEAKGTISKENEGTSHIGNSCSYES